MSASKRMPSPIALRAFEAAARLGSFKAAAEELHVTPTAVSHQIKALETRLGRPLFERNTRSIALTAAGRKVAPVLTRAFRSIEDVLEEVVCDKPVLTISTTPSFATLWLVPRLVDFHAQHADLEIRLQTTTRPTDLSRERRVDVAIRYGHGSYEGLHRTPLFDETVGAYVSPLPGRAGVKEWHKLPLLETAWQQNVLRNVNWAAWLAKAGLDPEDFVTVAFEEEEHVLHAAIAGRGVALASSVLAADFVDRDLLVPLRGDITLAGASYVALCLPERRADDGIDTFLGWIAPAP